MRAAISSLSRSSDERYNALRSPHPISSGFVSSIWSSSVEPERMCPMMNTAGSGGTPSQRMAARTITNDKCFIVMFAVPSPGAVVYTHVTPALMRSMMSFPDAEKNAHFHTQLARGYDASMAKHPGNAWVRGAFRQVVRDTVVPGSLLLDF